MSLYFMLCSQVEILSAYIFIQHIDFQYAVRLSIIHYNLSTNLKKVSFVKILGLIEKVVTLVTFLKV